MNEILQYLPHLIFVLLAGVTLAAAVAVVTLRNMLRSALALALALFGVASIYFLLQAEFIAMVQILIYVGAVMVLILFAIMLTQRLTEEQLHQFNGKWWLVAPLALLVFVLIAASVVGTNWLLRPNEALPENQTLMLGSQLMSTYALPFEIASVLLLVALVGAIVVAWPTKDRLSVEDELDARVAAVKKAEVAEKAEEAEEEAEPEPIGL